MSIYISEAVVAGDTSVYAEASPGSMTLAGLSPLAVAKGRIVAVSGAMVLQSNPPTPIVCVSGLLVDEAELTGYYQANFEDCD